MYKTGLIVANVQVVLEAAMWVATSDAKAKAKAKAKAELKRKNDLLKHDCEARSFIKIGFVWYQPIN